MSGRILLLSIRPEYADKIFRGIKKVELRRTRPRLCGGDLVIVYASSPRKALIGVFEVQRVIQKPLEDLWEEVQEKAGISYQDFCSYYEGVSIGCGIFLSKACYFHEPVNLERLRQEWDNFRPPQSYRYLTPNEVNIVETIADFDVSKFSQFYQITLNVS
ncbi:ASCH domain-containing protein [Egbenema bharatensis]|uniref:ASCH domain-containing protein n=1 Tax=Egbenema bharatensis TaxID=3463334 RepID=UPI003A878781